MSIYDEAIKEAEWHGEIEGSQTVKTIITALKRGKKVEELKDLLLKLDDCVTVGQIRDFYEEHRNKITELRKELEELK